MNFRIVGLKCEACAANLRLKLRQAIPEIESIRVDFQQHGMYIEFCQNSDLHASTLIKRIQSAIMFIDPNLKVEAE